MKQAYFKYILALLLFGSNGVVASHIALNSYEIVLLRSLLGSLLLIAIFFYTGHKINALQHKKDLCLIALSGIAMGADWLLLFEAYAEVGVSLGMLINYCGPAIVVSLSPMLFKERLTPRKLAALMTALLGVFLVSGKAAAEGASFLGLLCAGLSAVSYAAMVILNKKSRQVTGMANATLQLFFAFLTTAVFVGFKQGFTMQIDAGDWLPILWIGLLNTGVSCYLYFSSLGRLPVQTVAICGYLEPLSAVAYAFLLLGETLRPIQMFGALLIIGGAFSAEGLFNNKALAKKRHHRNQELQ